mmetsp:Transcript_8249/g.9007  ORF Transcript_8249/g.9007 Transcript_8249/m.9007 type:complete len:143 (-) Transcript_8249:756-1184(-)|eukprot:CAMPEP_0173157602 /NCGR_PEP_ID=MMETSP1105-20130129/15733_1 /TAXON_ID=2985 /ORGANISM="Ochromonas sp., Strain BG-1" /LENGTH=142 /DNA_ID=CAMNT_0014075119 /DNA_START=217 /DNA_END=645 /DNA_ORIENTATION=+
MLDDFRNPSPRTLGKRSRDDKSIHSNNDGDYSGHNVDFIDFNTPTHEALYHRRVIYNPSPTLFSTTTPSPTNRNVSAPIDENLKSSMVINQLSAPILLPVDFSGALAKYGAPETYQHVQLATSPKDTTWGWFIEEDESHMNN